MSNKWTHFTDSFSGGYKKLKWHNIYINEPREKAIQLFKEKLCRDPLQRSCGCCFEDYYSFEHDTLDQASAEDRGPMTVLDYIRKESVLVIPPGIPKLEQKED